MAHYLGVRDMNGHRPTMTMTLTDENLRQIIAAAVTEGTQDLRTQVGGVYASLKVGDDRMTAIESSIQKNNAETSATLAASKEMLEAFDFAKRGLAFIGACASFVGKLVTWAVKIGAPIATAYMAIRGFKWPSNK